MAWRSWRESAGQQPAFSFRSFVFFVFSFFLVFFVFLFFLVFFVFLFFCIFHFFYFFGFSLLLLLLLLFLFFPFPFPCFCERGGAYCEQLLLFFPISLFFIFVSAIFFDPFTLFVEGILSEQVLAFLHFCAFSFLFCFFRFS